MSFVSKALPWITTAISTIAALAAAWQARSAHQQAVATRQQAAAAWEQVAAAWTSSFVALDHWADYRLPKLAGLFQQYDNSHYMRITNLGPRALFAVNVMIDRVNSASAFEGFVTSRSGLKGLLFGDSKSDSLLIPELKVDAPIWVRVSFVGPGPFGCRFEFTCQDQTGLPLGNHFLAG